MSEPDKKRNQRGAISVIVAISLVLLFGAAAMAVDISRLVGGKQQLQNAMDAAAHAGAGMLPDDPNGAIAMAKRLAKMNDPDADPDVDMFCVIASKGASRQPEAAQIPKVCQPGPGWQARVVCNESICVIPCTPGPTTRCNTLRTRASKDVPYAFAPVIGHTHGSTGDVVSVACHGSCGDTAPNAMDVVVVADRTLSMAQGDLEAMKDGIKSMLTVMNPDLQYVALGTIHRASGMYSCRQSLSGTSGPWVATEFTNDYLLPGDPGNRALNPHSRLVEIVSCMRRPLPGEYTGGTHLAAAFNGAYRALRSANTSHLPSRPSEARKVIVFETDGMPDEALPRRFLSQGGDPTGGIQLARRRFNAGQRPPIIVPWASQTATERATGGGAGCERLEQIAEIAKNDGVLVVTIGYGRAATGGCNMSRLNGNGSFQTDGPRVADTLAKAASVRPDGTPSAADHDCSNPSGARAENTDGDYFFCAAQADELGDIFATAINQVSRGIRLLSLPS
ncbi:MAG: pilus assembly protein TadG-related protein [Propionibacteriaceae bacterium]|nr:pilus assembly protein TadG-related protein [Propionibacteriaceae bacterium]